MPETNQPTPPPVEPTPPVEQTPPPAQPTPLVAGGVKEPKKGSSLTWLIIVLLILLLGTGGWYYYSNYIQTSNTNTNTNANKNANSNVNKNANTNANKNANTNSSSGIQSTYDKATSIEPKSDKTKTVNDVLLPILKNVFANKVKLTDDSTGMLTYILGRTIVAADVTSCKTQLETAGYKTIDSSTKQLTVSKGASTWVISFSTDSTTKATVEVTY